MGMKSLKIFLIKSMDNNIYRIMGGCMRTFNTNQLSNKTIVALKRLIRNPPFFSSLKPLVKNKIYKPFFNIRQVTCKPTYFTSFSIKVFLRHIKCKGDVKVRSFFSYFLKPIKPLIFSNLFMNSMSPLPIFSSARPVSIMSLVYRKWLNALKGYSVLHGLILVLISSPVKALELKDFNVEITRFLGGDRHFAIPDEEKMEGAVNMRITIENDYVYLTPGVDSIYTNRQFRYMEGNLEAGTRILRGADIFYRHRSGHSLDRPIDSMEKYPKSDEIGIRFKFK